MQIDERMVVKSLVGSQINAIKARVNSMIDKFYDSYSPVNSLNRSQITSLIAELNEILYTIGGYQDD